MNNSIWSIDIQVPNNISMVNVNVNKKITKHNVENRIPGERNMAKQKLIIQWDFNQGFQNKYEYSCKDELILDEKKSLESVYSELIDDSCVVAKKDVCNCDDSILQGVYIYILDNNKRYFK